MKLRKIEIVGFKSFRDRVVLEVSDGMTCIVGPNGCGKSNVVDAIKWAMGDTSAKSLRGNSMQDVIFAGSETLKPMGMAEVTLVFENDGSHPSWSDAGEGEDGGDGERGVEMGSSIPREFRDMAEIAITRRLFRSGDSEYLINKVPCRLMDIQNLLAGTGLGKQGYSIIEQGQIGFVVNARPSQRRLIIEEASGITRYKGQRERAERRLEQTELNLQRTRDVLEEITKQLRSLERQARKAEEHRRLSDELRGLEIAALLQRRVQFATQHAQAQRELSERRRDAERLRREHGTHEEQMGQARIAVQVAERRHAELTEELYKLDTRLNLARAHRDHGARSVDDARERLQGLRADREAQRRRIESLQAELERVEAELAREEQTPDESEEQLEQVQAGIETLRSEHRALTARRDELRQRLHQTRTRLQRVEDRLEWIGTQSRDFDRRRTELDEQLEGAREEADDLSRAVNRLELDIERAADQVETHRSATERHTAALARAREEFREADDQARRAMANRVQLESRCESIEAMRKRGEGYADGVRKVLQWAQEQARTDVLGPAGDFLDVPEGLEAAAAACVGERIGDILVTSRQAALDALAMLADLKLGRVACHVVADPENPRATVERWLDGLEIVDSLDRVPDVLQPGTTRAWATRSGDILFADGRVVGGFVGEQAEGVLRQARELEQLRAELEAARGDEQEAQETLEVLQEDLEIVTRRLESSREALAQATHAERALIQDRENEERQLGRTTALIARLSGEVATIARDQEGLDSEWNQLEDLREQLFGQEPGLEVELEGLDAKIGEFEAELEARNSALTDQKVRLAQHRERRRNLEQSVERLVASIRSAENQVERLGREAEQQQERVEHFERSAVDAGEEATRLEAAYEAAKAENTKGREALDAAVAALQQVELATIASRKAAAEAVEAVTRLEMQERESLIGLENVDEQLAERFGLTAAEAQPIVAAIELDTAERPARITWLRKKLESMGAVNALAIEEFEETRQRKEFLEEQQSDLEKAVDDLRKAIARMDRESRKRFKETFDAINAKFQEVFPRLFRGGRAQLILTDPDNLLTTGVDIEVQPPGKRLQNVTLLSGGEKALTAVSLIFSIFMLKPTPFSILDEVDAPLDEANVGRFADMVREMSATSQMIVITHNRRTMEAPQILYGVTMEEPGVSKIVSVKLSDVPERMAS